MPHTPELTETQREERRTRARNAIETRLRETWSAWRRPGRKPNLALAADIALDSLGELAAEILVDGTMMRSLTMKDGVAALELDQATELVKLWVAGMRGVLDGYGAENYVEMEMTAPSVSMDVSSGGDAYTVTIQRRARMTPHAFRQKAERERDRILHIVADWHRSSEGRDVLAEDLAGAGFPLADEDTEAGR